MSAVDDIKNGLAAITAVADSLAADVAKRRWLTSDINSLRSGIAVAQQGVTVLERSSTPPPPSAFEFTSAAPPDGKVGVPYSHTFTSSKPGARFSIVGGMFPPGVGPLDPATGVIAGVPVLAKDDWLFLIEADLNGALAIQTCHVRIDPA